MSALAGDIEGGTPLFATGLHFRRGGVAPCLRGDNIKFISIWTCISSKTFLYFRVQLSDLAIRWSVQKSSCSHCRQRLDPQASRHAVRQEGLSGHSIRAAPFPRGLLLFTVTQRRSEQLTTPRHPTESERGTALSAPLGAELQTTVSWATGTSQMRIVDGRFIVSCEGAQEYPAASGATTKTAYVGAWPLRYCSVVPG